jgi:hypothetical protein
MSQKKMDPRPSARSEGPGIASVLTERDPNITKNATDSTTAGGTGRRAHYETIAKKYLPRGYTVEYRKSLSGRHYGRRNLIKAPKPVTAKALYIFLHECAHAYLHTGSGRKAAPRHVQEMQAEIWAHAKMEKHGIPVPPEMTTRAKRYVARKIVQAERRGAKNIDPLAIEYAGDHLTSMRSMYEKACGKSRHPNCMKNRPAVPVSAGDRGAKSNIQEAVM